MTERDELFAAVRDNPEDDTVRLVFADWLDENREENWARYIRAEIAGEQTTRDQFLSIWPNFYCNSYDFFKPLRLVKRFPTEGERPNTLVVVLWSKCV